MNNHVDGFLPRHGGLAREEEMRVFLAYEDAPDGFQAMRVLNPILTDGHAPLLAGCSVWRFAMLQVPEFRQAAVAEAAEADLMVVSIHDRGALPVEVDEWLREWVATRAERPAALIGILGGAPAGNGGAGETEIQLEEWARRAGTDFFLRRPGGWSIPEDQESEAESDGRMRPIFGVESGAPLVTE